MGRVIARDIFMGGFKYRYNDGVVEHFMPFILGEGFKGDYGSRIVPAFLGGMSPFVLMVVVKKPISLAIKSLIIGSGMDD